MQYIDVFKYGNKENPNFTGGLKFDLMPKVLAWSCDYETAVFYLHTPIHAETDYIWYQLRLENDKLLIIKVKLIDLDLGISRAVEHCYGIIPYRNQVVFDMDPVFPQNQRLMKLKRQ